MMAEHQMAFVDHDAKIAILMRGERIDESVNRISPFFLAMHGCFGGTWEVVYDDFKNWVDVLDYSHPTSMAGDGK